MKFSGRSPLPAVLMAALLILILSAPTHAQGLFGLGLPGLPSFGLCGGNEGCGDKGCPAGGLVGYIGWMENREGTDLSVNPTAVVLIGATSIRHKYPERGLWLGLTASGCLSDSISFLASGWYLVPSNDNVLEVYNFGRLARNWDTGLQWWYVDGLFAVGKQLSLLTGLRFDRYSNEFKDPSNAAGVNTNPNDTADVSSDGWIPLVGTQYAYSDATTNLTVRAVGFPVLLGTVKYKESFGGTLALEGKGNWTRGYFLEIFGEYGKKFGPGNIGVFGRFNATEGKSSANFDGLPVGSSGNYDISLRRLTWTVGGSVGLGF